MAITMIYPLVLPALLSARYALQPQVLHVLNASPANILTHQIQQIANALPQLSSILHWALVIHISAILYVKGALISHKLIRPVQHAKPLKGSNKKMQLPATAQMGTFIMGLGAKPVLRSARHVLQPLPLRVLNALLEH